ncbi:MAG: DNA mismatch repair endonuclease MutL, partial [Chitinispirillaceae bacterium]|nr:DNA mismatch repair endonuclease MutL [Chitinispirillaceae bacterium]
SGGIGRLARLRTWWAQARESSNLSFRISSFYNSAGGGRSLFTCRGLDCDIMPHRYTSIELLPLPVIEKIAAGEVIERPASVIKELVENSIDAGALKIDVAVDGAGFSRIVAADNGSGMDRADLEKCLLRHSTSKTRTADDLFAVSTLGFRGEALASVSAVSRFTITAAPDAGGLGHAVAGEGGVYGKSRPVAHGKGTTVEVRDLFYNVPARKKFMKSPRSEQAAVVRVMEQLAAAFPSVHFTLVIDGGRVLDFPAVDSLPARIGQIAGLSFAKGLIECRAARPGLDMTAYVSSPEVLQARPRFQGLYVNRRRVDCDAVTYAVREAFGQYLSSQYRPSFFCFLAVDPSRVDVNVHPAKQLVKFDDERSVAGFIYAAVKQGIGATLAVPGDLKAGGASAAPAEAAPEPVQEQLRLVKGDGAPAATPEQKPPGVAETIIPFPARQEPREQGTRASGDGHGPDAAWDLISCYQIHETYVLAPIKNGILLIDQHAAHERILFEQALEDIANGRAASQQLLFPVVIELSAIEKPVVLAGQSYFTSFGFEMSDFGGNALSASAIPFFMRISEVEPAVRLMVRYLMEEKERDVFKETAKRFAAAFACSAAIKAGQKLNQEEMNALVNSLFAAKNPYTCPHGRPTLVRISLDELARRFLR